MVITEFDAGDPEATMHALAAEILKYRRAVLLLAKAIGWADAGAPFALIAPGSGTGGGLPGEFARRRSGNGTGNLLIRGGDRRVSRADRKRRTQSSPLCLIV